MLQAPWLFSDDTVHLLPKPALAEARQAYVDPMIISAVRQSPGGNA